VGWGIKVVLLEVAVTVRTCVSLLAPVPSPDRFTACAPASSRMAAGLSIAASVGTSFMAVTFTATVASGESTAPSLTLNPKLPWPVPLPLATGA